MSRIVHGARPAAGLGTLADTGGPAQPLLSARRLVKHYRVGRGLLTPRSVLRAVDGVDIDVAQGETLGIVGESGCGKSTTARLIMALTELTSGEIVFDGVRLGDPGLPLRTYRRAVQMVFQDSYASLNPRMTVAETLAYGPRVNGMARGEAHALGRGLLDAVGLTPATFEGRYPHELSGGQRQRVNIARALALDPRLVVLDEPVSALDKPVEAQVLGLLGDLKNRLGLTYVLISHDLDVVEYACDRICVMYLGRIVEVVPIERVGADASHPYTQMLFSSRPGRGARRSRPVGEPPDPIAVPSGCSFHPRCPMKQDVCARVAPVLAPATSARHLVACHVAGPHVAGSHVAGSHVAGSPARAAAVAHHATGEEAG